jgi:hypothetical protein
MSNNNSSVPGMSYPTMQAMPAGNPRDSAIAEGNAMNAKQNSANQMTAGAKKRKIGGGIDVPQFTIPYKTPGGPGQDPNSLIAGNSKTSTQGAANSEFDKNALIGGSRRRKGGNPDWIWGCFSGGKKKKTRTNKRKTRRHRKKTRRYKK